MQTNGLSTHTWTGLSTVGVFGYRFSPVQPEVSAPKRLDIWSVVRDVSCFHLSLVFIDILSFVYTYYDTSLHSDSCVCV